MDWFLYDTDLHHERVKDLHHFASKNQLPGFYVSGRLVENGLKSRKLLIK